MYQAKSGVKKFSLYRWGMGGGGGGGGGVLKKIFGPNMYQAKSGVKKISLYRKVTSKQPSKQTDIHTYIRTL